MCPLAEYTHVGDGSRRRRGKISGRTSAFTAARHTTRRQIHLRLIQFSDHYHLIVTVCLLAHVNVSITFSQFFSSRQISFGLALSLSSCVPVRLAVSSFYLVFSVLPNDLLSWCWRKKCHCVSSSRCPPVALLIRTVDDGLTCDTVFRHSLQVFSLNAILVSFFICSFTSLPLLISVVGKIQMFEPMCRTHRPELELSGVGLHLQPACSFTIKWNGESD